MIDPRAAFQLRRLIVSVALSAFPVACAPETDQPKAAFEIGLGVESAEELQALGLNVPADGRVFVILSTSEEREPRLQTSLTGVPLWGMDVSDLGPGETVTLQVGGDGVLGYPLESTDSIPDGEYFVQAFMNVYTTFDRADGHTVKMHLNSGAGQSPFRAPGNLHSPVYRVRFDKGRADRSEFVLSEVIPPTEPLEEGGVLQQGNPQDSDHVKFVKIRSEVLSEFWGQDMYIGANVLLPAGYEEQADTYYPTMYSQGHFPGARAPFGYQEPDASDQMARGRSAGFTDFWHSGTAPGMIAVTIRDANPFYDTSYSVNSVNVGPYGDAIHNELIPYLESRFRMIPEPWARTLSGGSTGGWEAIAMQIFYPDVYGGAWGWCPDALDFNYHQIVNIYDDPNAYFTEYDWMKVERPNARRPDGNVRSTVRMENHYERTVGPNSRSAGQWAIWEAVYGPLGPDGFPAPIWDPDTGVIDHEVAESWRQNYDLTHYLRENWGELGDRLRGKIHIAVGDMDTYYLEQGVYKFEELVSSLSDPPADFTFEYGRKKPHCWIGYSPNRPGQDLSNVEFLRIAADRIREQAPAGTSHTAWYR